MINLSLNTDAPGEDLGSSYLGCQLIAHNQTNHLFDYDEAYFNRVNTKAWKDVAMSSGYFENIHAYVQIPLWAWSLQPICTNITFKTFNLLFSIIQLICIVLIVELTAKKYTPFFLNPLPLSFVMAILSMTTPFQYAVFLTQTHAIFMLLVILSLYYVDNKPKLAGLSLALAVIVKVSPIFIMIYWFINKKFKAIISFSVSTFALITLTISTTGLNSFTDYIHSMSRVSKILLLSYNNQSFISFIAYKDILLGKISPHEIWRWKILTINNLDKFLSFLILIVLVCLFGFWSKKYSRFKGLYETGLLIITALFVPIAWTHYFIILTPVLMVLYQKNLELESQIKKKISRFIVLIILLNTEIIGMNPITLNNYMESWIPYFEFSQWLMIHSHFISGICVLILIFYLTITFKYSQKPQYITDN
ncbi:hypothetical protein HMPREF9021_00485 [Simonsiella muelleri ATCC 29453]|uniref:DUF2029 domain-containing protein n=2 Tax=Simonsiella TaxID=71 RepID=V9H9T8_9NEIS|nr:hypothetical protein HMPREF9021_00485 [Simonsiella muelleri ATCC 29453]